MRIAAYRHKEERTSAGSIVKNSRSGDIREQRKSVEAHSGRIPNSAPGDALASTSGIKTFLYAKEWTARYKNELICVSAHGDYETLPPPTLIKPQVRRNGIDFGTNRLHLQAQANAQIIEFLYRGVEKLAHNAVFIPEARQGISIGVSMAYGRANRLAR